jgi:chlorite dismutase
MDEVSESLRLLNFYAVLSFKDAYWSLSSAQRAEFHRDWLENLRAAARMVDVYQVYPAEGNADMLVWCALPITEQGDTARFFEKFAAATNPHRAYLETHTTLWGFTHPSQYSRASRSAQDIDPLDDQRQTYLIVYPFVKTVDWYLMSREARQGMMNEHIRIGKQYTDIKQLLLYSYGLQDQEFVVVYETENLPRFSDLVAELRGVDGRKYTLRDTPIYTAIYHPAEETLALWR